MDAANEALSAAQGALSSIQSALSSIRGQQEVDELSWARAMRDLSNMVKAGALPEQDRLDQTLTTLTGSGAADTFGTQAQYRASQGALYANLVALEKMGLGEVDAAQATVDALQAQIEAQEDYFDAEMKRLDEAAEAAADWRDAEMERLDDILEDAKLQLDALMGIDTTLLSVEEALNRFLGTLPTYLVPRGREYGEMPGDPGPGVDGGSLLNTASTQSSEQTDELRLLREEVAAMRKDMAAIGTAQLTPMQSLDDRTRKWDLQGTPPPRADADHDRTVVVVRAA
jgi:hypothetical protein